METQSNWADISWRLRLQVIAGRSTVMVELLQEDETLVAMAKRGDSLEKCLEYVNENF